MDSHVVYIKEKHPDKVPILLEPKDDNVPALKRNKFIVQGDLTINQFIIILRRYTDLNSQQGIFIFTKNSNQLLSSMTTLRLCYDKFADSDGFLRIVYTKENVFG